MSRIEKLDADAPTLPPNTCPDIDSVKRTVRSISRDARDAGRRCEHDETTSALDSIERDIDDLEDPLEELRTANGTLREAAVYWRDRCIEMCAELEERDAKDSSAADA